MLNRLVENPIGKLGIWLLPPVVYFWHATLTGNWIVDDAGITFAYAKNLAQGHGITAQPGMAPVEGYSNPLWMLILSLAHFLRVFHVVLTPKIISGLCFLGTAFFVRKTFLALRFPEWNALGVMMLLAVNTPYVLWANSGLENGLYVFLLSLLLYRLFSSPDHRADLTISLLLILVRPEAFLWGLLFPLSYFLKRNNVQPTGRIIGVFFAGWIVFLMLISLFRRLYFGDWLPNPFYVKMPGADYSLSHLFGEKRKYLSFAIGGFWTTPVVFLCLFAFLFFRRLRNNSDLKILFSATLLSLLLFIAMPDDWMKELGFGSPFVFFFTLFAWLLAVFSYQIKFSLKSVGLFILIFSYQAYHFSGRTQNFMDNPTVPLAEVKAEYADRYNQLAELPGMKNATVLIPDVGAMYYYGSMRVMDAAGLTDKNIALRLRDSVALREWILEESQPEFIHLHGRWNLLYNLSSDPRFAQRYSPLHEFSDSLFLNGRMNYFTSGDYVHVSVKERVPPEELKNKMGENP